MTKDQDGSSQLAATGIVGLDDVLSGGFQRNRLYMVEGVPGAGKTTLALQFLLNGVQRGETVLYVTLSETQDELGAVAQSHGWSLDGMHIRELVPGEECLRPDEQYTVFHPSEVELSDTTKLILSDVERMRPTRLVLDSLSEMRLLTGSSLRYRRQILALKQFFAGNECTVLMLDDLTTPDHDLQVQSIAHAVVRLEQMNPEYGAERRRLSVLKYRGVKFRGGFHDYVIRRGGIAVYPRLVAGEHHRPFVSEKLSSGIDSLDALIGGGLECGTSTLILGAAGTGKSSLAAQFVTATAARGGKAALFVFDETTNLLLSRTDQMNIPLRRYVTEGRVFIQQVDPAELSPGALTHSIRRMVDQGISMVVIDSLNGYLQAMPGERFLTIQLHELLTYLGHSNVATILISTQLGLIGSNISSPADASYLADSIILMRYFELKGEVHQSISMVKKRGGAHERTIREFRVGTQGIQVGEVLRQFRGILTGVPVYDTAPLVGGERGA